MEPKLTSCDLIRALTSDEFANHKYEIEQGKIYLTDGTTRTVNVDLSIAGMHPSRFKRETNDFILLIEGGKELNKCSFSDTIKSLIKEQFINDGSKCSEMVDLYYKSHGMMKVSIDEKKIPDLMKNSKNMSDIIELCKGCLSTAHVRQLVGETLNRQEELILEKIPEEAFSHPEVLRQHFTELLKDKGLLYEQAVAQFDWTQEIPQKNAVEDSYVLAKLIAQVDAWKALLTKGGENFPFKDVWRFCIDGSHQHFGAYYYENEPFYILSSLRGLKNILESQNKASQMSQATYEGYAAALMRNPPILRSALKLKLEKIDARRYTTVFFECKMSNEGQGFPISSYKKDPIGIADLEQRTAALLETHKRLQLLGDAPPVDADYWMLTATGFIKDVEFLNQVTITTHAIIAQRICLGLKQLLEKAKSPGERLIAYIWAAREFELTHQLRDGNGRTSINFLIKCIADDPSLPIYMPEDPNILDLQGPEPLLRDIYSGMLWYKNLSGSDTKDMISVELLIDQAGIRGKSWDVIHQLAELPQEVIAKLVTQDKLSPRNPRIEEVL